MKYDEQYMRSKDIDWFCIINERYVHIASAGAILPDVINDREKLRNLQREVFYLPEIFTNDELLYNKNVIQTLHNNNAEGQSNYLRSFEKMARKGFISIDRTNYYDPDDQNYHIVCMPKQLLQHEGLKLGRMCEFESENVVIDKVDSSFLFTELSFVK